MRVVVTGASGNVGTALLRALDGWDVLAVARHRPGLAPPYSAARWITCDLGTADGAAVLPSAFAGADAVVHLAWAIHPRRGEPPMARTNQTGTANVLRAVVDAGVPHVVCASSVAAYSPAERWTSVSEDWRRGGVPGSAYSAGKAALETRLDAFEERHPEVRLARIRPCGIVQRDAAAQFTDWLLSPWLPRGLLTRRWLPVPLWPGLRLQVVHTDDVARALRLVLESRATGPFNLAGEPVLTSRALAGIAGGARLPVPLPVLTAAAEVTWRLGLQPLHPAWLRLADQAALIDTTRARTELGWTPTPDVGGVVADLLAAIRAGHRGTSGPLAPGRATVRLGRPSHQSQRAWRSRVGH